MGVVGFVGRRWRRCLLFGGAAQASPVMVHQNFLHLTDCDNFNIKTALDALYKRNIALNYCVSVFLLHFTFGGLRGVSARHVKTQWHVSFYMYLAGFTGIRSRRFQ